MSDQTPRLHFFPFWGGSDAPEFGDGRKTSVCGTITNRRSPPGGRRCMICRPTRPRKWRTSWPPRTESFSTCGHMMTRSRVTGNSDTTLTAKSCRRYRIQPERYTSAQRNVHSHFHDACHTDGMRTPESIASATRSVTGPLSGLCST